MYSNNRYPTIFQVLATFVWRDKYVRLSDPIKLPDEAAFDYHDYDEAFEDEEGADEDDTTHAQETGGLHIL